MVLLFRVWRGLDLFLSTGTYSLAVRHARRDFRDDNPLLSVIVGVRGLPRHFASGELLATLSDTER